MKPDSIALQSIQLAVFASSCFFMPLPDGIGLQSEHIGEDYDDETFIFLLPSMMFLHLSQRITRLIMCW